VIRVGDNDAHKAILHDYGRILAWDVFDCHTMQYHSRTVIHMPASLYALSDNNLRSELGCSLVRSCYLKPEIEHRASPGSFLRRMKCHDINMGPQAISRCINVRNASQAAGITFLSVWK
jgi:hypothetical protein